MTDEPATRTLTYRELSDALGISLRAAEARARRRVRQGHWRPYKGNDGIIRLAIPAAALEVERAPTEGDTKPPAAEGTAGAPEGDPHPHNAPGVLTELQATLARLSEQLAGELREARELADRRAVELAELRERVGCAEAERDNARAERERAEQKAAGAQTELAAWTAGGPLSRAIRALLYRR